jgi:hypothetical protein
LQKLISKTLAQKPPSLSSWLIESEWRRRHRQKRLSLFSQQKENFEQAKVDGDFF